MSSMSLTEDSDLARGRAAIWDKTGAGRNEWESCRRVHLRTAADVLILPLLLLSSCCRRTGESDAASSEEPLMLVSSNRFSLDHGEREKSKTLNRSRPSSPSSLITRHLNVATVVLLLVLNGSDTVHSWRVLKLDPLTWWGSMLVLLENTLSRAGVGVSIRRLKHRGILPTMGNRTDGRWRDGSSWHHAGGPRRQQRKWWARSGVLSSRDAERQLRLGDTGGVHFDIFSLFVLVVELSKYI